MGRSVIAQTVAVKSVIGLVISVVAVVVLVMVAAAGAVVALHQDVILGVL